MVARKTTTAKPTEELSSNYTPYVNKEIVPKSGSNTPNLSAALAQAAHHFSVAVKDAKNPFYKSNYATLSSVMDAIWDALVAEGLVVQQEVRSKSLYTILRHSSGEYQEYGPYPLPSIEDDPQKFGSAVTYARRYAIMPLFGVTPEDDDGNAAKDAVENKKKVAISAINKLVEEQGIDTKTKLPENWERFGIDELRQIYTELKKG